MDQWPDLMHLHNTTLTRSREHQRSSKGSKTNAFSSFWPQFPFPISSYRTTFTCLWYFIILCLWAICAVLYLHWQWSLYAAFSKWMQITESFVYGHVPRLCTTPDLQDPTSQMSQDKTWKSFSPSESLTDTHFITHKKTTFFFLLYFWDFLPLCKIPIIFMLDSVSWQRKN